MYISFEHNNYPIIISQSINIISINNKITGGGVNNERDFSRYYRNN